MRGDVRTLRVHTRTRTRPSPLYPPASGAVVAFATAYRHTCALLTGGSVVCWGRNDYGQLGTGDTMSRLTPTVVSGLGAGTCASGGTEKQCGRMAACCTYARHICLGGVFAHTCP